MKKIIVLSFLIVTLCINNVMCMNSYDNTLCLPVKTKPYVYNSIDLLSNDAALLKHLIEKEKKGLYSRRLCAAGETLEIVLKQQGFGINIEKMFGVEAINLAQLVMKKEAIKNELFGVVSDFCSDPCFIQGGHVCRKFQHINCEFPDALNAHYSEINGGTLMHYIASLKHDELFYNIIRGCHNINLNVSDKQRNTLLHMILMCDTTPLKTIEYFLRCKKVDLALFNKHGEIPMDIARKYNQGHWWYVMCEAVQGKLDKALRSKNHQCEKIAKLLYAGADAGYNGKIYTRANRFFDKPPLHYALLHNCKQCITLLLQKVNKKNINEALSFQHLFEQSPLRKAIINELPEVVLLCLSVEKARVKEKYSSLESTPLLLAAISGCIESVKIVLDHGALVNYEILLCPWIDDRLIKLLEDACRKQVCSICYHNQESLLCSLDYMPCTKYHPNIFLCADCYGKIGNIKGSCPICRKDLKEYSSPPKIYQMWG